jgi:hypothetical protein
VVGEEAEAQLETCRWFAELEAKTVAEGQKFSDLAFLVVVGHAFEEDCHCSLLPSLKDRAQFTASGFLVATSASLPHRKGAVAFPFSLEKGEGGDIQAALEEFFECLFEKDSLLIFRDITDFSEFFPCL